MRNLASRLGVLFTCGGVSAITFMPVQGGGPQAGASVRYTGLVSTVQQGKQLFAEHKFKASEQAFNKCLAAIPDHHEAHYFLSQIEYHRSRYPDALRHIDASIQSLLDLQQRYLEAQTKRTRDAEHQKQALEQFTQANESEEVNCMTGSVRWAEHAAKEFESSGRDQAFIPDAYRVPASHFFTRANCLFRLGRMEEAVGDYLKAVEADPKHAGSWNNLINILFLQQKFERAKEELKRAEAQKVVVQPGLKRAVLQK